MAPADVTHAWPIRRFSEIDSTNEEARRRAESLDFGPCWLSAERQSAGRGRLGRTWDSPKGNLSATALFGLAASLREASLVCFSAGLAVIDAAEAAGVAAERLSLKWPNDVLAGEAKLAGVLIETGAADGGLWMAAGFGVNIAEAPARPDRATACLSALPGGEGLTADAFLTRLDAAFRRRLMRLFAEGFEPTRRDWLARAGPLGARIEAGPPMGRVSGVMRDLASDGALILQLADGALHHVRAGEISILSPSAG